MRLFKPRKSPDCTHLQLSSQLIPVTEQPGRQYIDTHLQCSHFDKRIKKSACIDCEKYKPVKRSN